MAQTWQRIALMTSTARLRDLWLFLEEIKLLLPWKAPGPSLPPPCVLQVQTFQGKIARLRRYSILKDVWKGRTEPSSIYDMIHRRYKTDEHEDV